MSDNKDLYMLSIVSVVAIIGILVLVLTNASISGNASKKVSETLPFPVDLVAPSNGAVDVSLTPTFDWVNTKRADYEKGTYTQSDYIVLYLDDDRGFSTPLIQEFQLRKNMRAYTLPSGVVLPGTTYYWRVVTYNIAGGTNSETYTFTTAMS